MIENIEELMNNLEMVIAEEVVALREARKQGEQPSPVEIALGYLNPKFGEDEHLSQGCHVMALACMVALTLHWLSFQEEVVGQ